MTTIKDLKESMKLIKPITLAVGETLSEGIKLVGQRLTHVYIPSNFTGNKLEFYSSMDNGATYKPLANIDDDILSIAKATPPITKDRIYILPDDNVYNCDFLKIKSDIIQAGSDCIIEIKLKKV